MLTWTVLRSRSIRPLFCGIGRTGSIQPCASKADEKVHRTAATPKTRELRMDNTWLGMP
jgi:hypothetical protein